MTTYSEPAPSEAKTEDGITVLGFDHLVLKVDDVERSLRFYTGILGLPADREEEWRAGTVPFPSVRISPEVVIDLDGRVAKDGSNVHHYCLEVEVVDLAAVARRPDLVVVGGPFRRWGARGEADLLYIADPDGNVIELRHYGPAQGFGYHGDGPAAVRA